MISVCNLSKNTIWKQITTGFSNTFTFQNLYAIYQRTQSESKSQRSLSFRVDIGSVCNLSKNTIWKQITTIRKGWSPKQILYAIYQRTQSESKSQLFNQCTSWRRFCMQSIKEHNLKANHNFQGDTSLENLSVCNLSKNTIWKQITTGWLFSVRKLLLYAIYQRTQSESKSQLLL